MWGPPGGSQFPGGVPPAVTPSFAGVPPAVQQSYAGAPPPGSQYGAPPPGSHYGAPPPGSQYGAPPPGSQYGAPPPQGAYGQPSYATPPQGYSQYSQGAYPPPSQGAYPPPAQSSYPPTGPPGGATAPTVHTAASIAPATYAQPLQPSGASSGSFSAPPPQHIHGVPPGGATAPSLAPSPLSQSGNLAHSGNLSHSGLGASGGHPGYAPGGPPPQAQPYMPPQPTGPKKDQQRCLLIVKVHKARNLKWGATKLISFTAIRPFCSVMVDSIKWGNTGVASGKDIAPEWNETFLGVTSSFLPDSSPSAWVTIVVRHYSDIKGSEVGSCTFQPTKATGPDSYTPQWRELKGGKGKGDLYVSAVAVPIDEAGRWTQTPTCDMQLRNACSMKLYQDAYCPALLPGLPPKHCYEDMYHSFCNARRFIYITGWSVWTNLKLLRDRPCPTLGELLVQKANEGVQVCIMIWDEFTSFENNKKQGAADTGMMNTYDEETREFFKHTKVTLQAMFRSGHQRIEEVYFTHHQKTIILDEGPKVVAYVGGLDLTNGRWDNPNHCLFSTLNTDHKEDWYQGCVPTATKETGPRQPWHDIHSRVEGTIALDVYENFRGRWYHNPTNPNTTWGEFHVGARAEKWTPPPSLIDVKKDYPNAGVGPEGTWSCQLLRSIDSYSIDFALDNSRIIRSIHNSYILRIATAQRYIYIENQYFMGSSHYWGTKADPGIRNLIPITIVDKIISKIDHNEDFCCYIIVPLFPEGDPETMGVKALLRWQFNTMKMMHKRIYDAIQSHGLSGKTVEDYLVFMCLGQREDPNQAGGAAMARGGHGSIVNGRQMVYVHSKMLIVDDEYILIGSANINDRSMRGNRDTEIAVIGHETAPHGGARISKDIADFRSSLWVEHFGAYNPVFQHPQSPACNRHIRQIADANWKIYENDAWTPQTKLHGLACTYPYETRVGEVDSLPGTGTIPDFKLAPVVGEMTPIPNQITT